MNSMDSLNRLGQYTPDWRDPSSSYGRPTWCGTESSMCPARLQRIPTADALEGIPGQTSPKVREELSTNLMTSRLHERETLESGSNRVPDGLIGGRKQRRQRTLNQAIVVRPLRGKMAYEPYAVNATMAAAVEIDGMKEVLNTSRGV